MRNVPAGRAAGSAHRAGGFILEYQSTYDNNIGHLFVNIAAMSMKYCWLLI